MSEDGCALLHCQEQGEAGSGGQEEDYLLHCHHTGEVIVKCDRSSVLIDFNRHRIKLFLLRPGLFCLKCLQI